MFIAKNNDLIILAKDTREELEQALQFMQYTAIEETSINYQLYNGEYLTPEQIEKQEQERIKMLSCTKRDFALMLQELGVTYTQLKTLIASSEQAQLEWDLCERLYRFNPLLDVMAAQLGITPLQLDMIFKTINGENTVEELRNTRLG